MEQVRVDKVTDNVTFMPQEPNDRSKLIRKLR